MSSNFVKQLFDLNIIEQSESEFGDVGDTKGFDETQEEFMDRTTKWAREDYERSGPGSRFGGEDVFG